MIVFLDFDGVLHPNEVVLYQKRGIVLECDGHSLEIKSKVVYGRSVA